MRLCAGRKRAGWWVAGGGAVSKYYWHARGWLPTKGRSKEAHRRGKSRPWEPTEIARGIETEIETEIESQRQREERERDKERNEANKGDITETGVLCGDQMMHVRHTGTLSLARPSPSEPMVVHTGPPHGAAMLTLARYRSTQHGRPTGTLCTLDADRVQPHSLARSFSRVASRRQSRASNGLRVLTPRSARRALSVAMAKQHSIRPVSLAPHPLHPRHQSLHTHPASIPQPPP